MLPTAKRNLLILGLVCLAPMVGSYLLYYLWRPGAARNYGELIPPTRVSLKPVPPADSTGSQMSGRWVMVMVDGGACAGGCPEKLWQMRQLRLTQGKEMERVVRLWLVDDEHEPGAAPLNGFEGTIVLKSRDLPELAAALRDRNARDHLFLVDPIGNLMMRFPRNPDLTRVKKDLGHLLKVSRIG